MTEVATLADEFVGYLFEVDPLTPALLGIRPDAEGLGDPSGEAERAHRARLAGFVERALVFEPSGLSPEDRVTRDVLVSTAQSRIDHIDTRFVEFTVSDLFVAPAAAMLTHLPMLPVAAGSQATAHLGRLEALPLYLERTAQRHRDGVADGLVPVAHLVAATIAQLDRYLADPAADPLRTPPGPDEEFDKRREELLRDVVRPAFAAYREVLATEIAPHGRPADKPGLCWLPGGERIYALLARTHTTTDRGPQELHETGLALIAKLAEEYRTLGSRVFGTDQLAEIFAKLRTDPALRWSDAEELLETARSAITRAEAEAPNWFGRIPPQPWEVRSSPPEAGPAAPAAYYMPSTTDGSRPGVYFANTHEATERFRHAAEATAFHEAIPGHHFQLSIAQGLEELPLLRRIGDFNAYIEGWGLYTERLAQEMGLYSDDVALLGMLTLDSMRAGRLVVDTGLHSLGWSRQQAVDYLLEHTPMAPVEIESEVDRYIAFPGQALSYMVGRLEILRIRAAAEQALGERFDIRGFHDVVLGGGALPLSVLDDVVTEWVAGLKSPVDVLADELVAVKFDAEPLFPAILGIPGDTHRLADLSEENEARLRESYVDIAERAGAIVRSGLSTTEAITRDVVIQQARAAVDTLDARAAEFSVSDGLSAPGLYLLTLLSELTLNDEEHARGYLRRLAAIPGYLETVTQRQRGGVAAGLVPPVFLAEAGIAQVGRYLAQPENDPLRREPTVPVEGYQAECERLLAEEVRPAFARYREFLAAEVVPAGRPETEPGLSWLPGGARMYAGLIRVHTTTERSAQDLHETGLGMIAKLADEYRELGARVFGTKDLAEIFERLRTDPELHWRDGDELLDAARDAITRAEAVAPQWFSSVPEEHCEVAPVPDNEAEGGTIAYYLHPAFDGTRPGTYYANTHGASERPRHTSEAIAFHEAVPGHHFQLVTAHGLTALPLLRRIADVNSYIEGWGLYAERLADEMGLYSSDVTRLGMLTQDSMRAGRLVVDTGLHALGWSRQRAVDYLREHTPMALVEIEVEIDRYAAIPGQALSYMVGRLEIQRVRAAAEEKLGDRFDIREFHDVVLRNGILPLPVLDTVVAEWANAR
ncbi:DUF885 domain-containing protein [Amycolatopsis sp. H20-H5]|uniref:DUF885 domain-containing protein n=1 Tax=Amycolatopsis sp. H20-H5 TaxID=3046309 RepID=UPI002DB6FDA3|nr:DUF885 domain-containing protein [Amycolatopsis sp. H20-H5]MEC3977702.1 DUF885 domain-containing protein [Amycolatopsis sp. H20-H5]